MQNVTYDNIDTDANGKQIYNELAISIENMQRMNLGEKKITFSK